MSRQSPPVLAVLLAVILVLASVVGLLRLTASSAPLAENNPAPDIVGAGELAVPLRVTEYGDGAARALVEVWIQDKGPYPFLVDTGASRSILQRQLAEELGLEEAGEKVSVAGVFASGEASIVRVEQWRLGEQPLPPSTLLALKMAQGEARGLLGADVFSQFGAVTVDFAREVLVLNPGPPSPTLPGSEPSPTPGPRPTPTPSPAPTPTPVPEPTHTPDPVPTSAATPD